MRDARSVLITGASSGIGAALALAYAGPGMRLALTGRHLDRLETVVDACRGAGASVHSKLLDITDASAVAAWVAEIDREWSLDLVIASAGVTGGHNGPGAEESLTELRH